MRVGEKELEKKARAGMVATTTPRSGAEIRNQKKRKTKMLLKDLIK